MNGRLENSLNIYGKIEEELLNMPDFMLDWYYYLKANKKSATTCRDYIRKAKLFLSTINKNINEIVPEDIENNHVIKYFIKIQTKEVNVNGIKTIEDTSDSYRQTVWSCLNNLFEFLYNEGKIQYNFISKLKVERPKNKDLARINRHRVLLTDDDFKSIIDAVNNGIGSNKAKGYQRTYRARDLCMLNLFMTTGMRKGALRSINVSDINFENSTLSVIDKGDILHEYSLSPTSIYYIKEWMRDKEFLHPCAQTEALFVSNEGNRISEHGIDKIVAKYSNAALGRAISPHKLRSGFISIIQNKTHDIEFTRRVAGHANVTTTQRYIVTDNKEREKASNMMESIFKE